VPYVVPAGGNRRTLLRLAPLRNPAGDIIGVVGVAAREASAP
jgi:hypothetical protein